MYNNDAPGTVRAPSEYVVHDEEDRFPATLHSLSISFPVLTSVEAAAVLPTPTTRQTRARARAARALEDAPVGSPPPSPAAATPTGLAPTPVAPASPAPAPKRRARAPRPPLPRPETGRPETAKEFSKRIRRVVLHGPRIERQEGGDSRPPRPTVEDVPDEEQSGNLQPPMTDEPQDCQQGLRDTPLDRTHPTDREDRLADPQAKMVREMSLLTYLSENTEGIDLLQELKGRYAEDKLFRAILDKPKEFKNFQVREELIFLRENGRDLLCIPEVLHNGRSRILAPSRH
ncbi:hypothetical protein K466DRAFT_607688 [Polyporus arcularius HHB13444]|uniref:Uncharacterized protein n=1 Tax=Polyporus arcularius HHB13444 TaxID=1314778 RepID=A0A5C3NMA7_9APHY|nr:hypothetical protein K466DRAFT_607688 [Polyporus arcularius HHB13444]